MCPFYISSVKKISIETEKQKGTDFSVPFFYFEIFFYGISTSRSTASA